MLGAECAKRPGPADIPGGMRQSATQGVSVLLLQALPSAVISLAWSISQFKLLTFKPKWHHLSINWKLPQFMDLGGQ